MCSGAHVTTIYIITYSGTSLMWTAKGQTKSVHNSEVSTLVKLGHFRFQWLGLERNQTGRENSVHSGGVSTVVGCPQGEVLLYL